jgi:chromosome partitioning protein
MASTNASVKDKERADFVAYLSEFPEFEVLESIGFSRKVYKDASSEGLSVLETNNAHAQNEIEALVKEVYGHAS